MDPVYLFSFLGLLSLAFAYIFFPLIPKNSTSSSQHEEALQNYEDLLFQKSKALENLMELDHDREFGKVNEEDYEDIRNRLLREADAIYQSLKTLEQNDPFFSELEIGLQTKRGKTK
mgnify:CR=1 FL=1